MRYFIGVPLMVAALTSLFYGMSLNVQIVNSICGGDWWGFFAGVIALLLLPITAVLIPLAALLKWGLWMPLAATWGGSFLFTLAGALLSSGKRPRSGNAN
jgi:hypothetical protein